MITLAATILWVLTFYLAIKAANPVKMAILLILIRAFTFLLLGIHTSSVWFSIIFLMLFTGGILIMFMILSSILPNEKAIKSKSPATIILIFSALIPLTNPYGLDTLAPSTKWFLASGSTLVGTVALVSRYFLAFVYILSKRNSPLRSDSCQNKENFVNFLKEKWQYKLSEKKTKQSISLTTQFETCPHLQLWPTSGTLGPPWAYV